MADIIQTLQLKEDPTTKVFPNIKEGNIPSGAISSDKLASNSVTSAKIADSAIQSRHFAAGAVDNYALSNGSVNTDKLNTDAVTSGKILNGAVTRTKIANEAVNRAKTTIKIINLWDYCRCDQAIDIQTLFQALEMEFFGLVANGYITILFLYVLDYDVTRNFNTAEMYFNPSEESMVIRVLQGTSTETWEIGSNTSLVVAEGHLSNLKLVIME